VELEIALRDAAERRRKGASTTYLGDDGRPIVDDIPANDPRLVTQEETAQRVCDWVTANVTVVPRPLELLPLEESAVRGQVGASSYDGLELATARGIPLYADDLGLRRFRLSGRPMQSFSTVTLLPALVARGILEAAARDNLLVRLVGENHAHVRPTVDLITAALGRSPKLPPGELRRVFDLLGNPGLTLPDAAAIAIAVVRREAMQRVHRHSLAKLTELAMDGMGQQWPATSVAAAIQSVARGQLGLLPQHLETVEKTGRDWARGRLTS
jgi:hypothetical protein